MSVTSQLMVDSHRTHILLTSATHRDLCNLWSDRGPLLAKKHQKIWNSRIFFLYLQPKQKINKMTAIDLRANTMQILDQFDKADASLWQKVFDAVTLIYKGEEKTLHTKRAEQKAKIRQMVGILNEDSLEDWKREKEEYLTEKYQ